MDYEAVRDQVDQGITGALTPIGEMTTRWVAVIETIDVAGARSAWTLSSEDMRGWDVMGLLSYGLEWQRVCIAENGELAP